MIILSSLLLQLCDVTADSLHSTHSASFHPHYTARVLETLKNKAAIYSTIYFADWARIFIRFMASGFISHVDALVSQRDDLFNYSCANP
jgi:hypothetical protein